MTYVTQPLSRLKKAHNEVAIATFFFNRVFAPEGEILSFAQPLESIQRKGGSIAAASCPPTDARHPCRAPSG